MKVLGNGWYEIIQLWCDPALEIHHLSLCESPFFIQEQKQEKEMPSEKNQKNINFHKLN